MAWPKHPIIYEMNTWVWLDELTRKYKESITLGNVPARNGMLLLTCRLMPCG